MEADIERHQKEQRQLNCLFITAVICTLTSQATLQTALQYLLTSLFPDGNVIVMILLMVLLHLNILVIIYDTRRYHRLRELNETIQVRADYRFYIRLFILGLSAATIYQSGIQWYIGVYYPTFTFNPVLLTVLAFIGGICALIALCATIYIEYNKQSHIHFHSLQPMRDGMFGAG